MVCGFHIEVQPANSAVKCTNHQNKDSVHLRKATELRSYISIVMVIAVPVGAPVGGALTQGIGWRWAFIIQIPMGLVCLAMALWRLRSAKRSDSQGERDISPRPDINLLGILLLGLLVASLMTICQFSGELRSKLTIGLPIASSIFFASALLFGINERCWTNTPLVPLKLLKTNSVGLMYLAQFFLLFSYGGVSQSCFTSRTFTDSDRADIQSYYRILDADKELWQRRRFCMYTASCFWKCC